MKPLDDVTAVVLTLDEPYTARALASIERQAAPVAEVVVVNGTSPFHRAFNEGMARVRTPYFVQVDADMILDPDCVADLRAAVADGVGVVIGFLADPILGAVGGIKLFRTACFELERFRDSISPDTDFYDAIARRGWTTVYALRFGAAGASRVFGEHAPEYTPLYTFRKFELLGSRHRYRRSAEPLRDLFRGLRSSPHPAALFALIGTARGLTLAADDDRLVPYGESADVSRLESFLAERGGAAAMPEEIPALPRLEVREAWRRGYLCGIDLYRRRAPGAFLAALDCLDGEGGTVAWVALVGLCQGVFADAPDDAELERAFELVNQVLPRPYRIRARQRVG